MDCPVKPSFLFEVEPHILSTSNCSNNRKKVLSDLLAVIAFSKSIRVFFVDDFIGNHCRVQQVSRFNVQRVGNIEQNLQ